eukprot:CAMPEP_0197586658 /NCGR_PEP_ID=MMETSP1326-20131121/8558_1 /TAXON_ID=1155430 /ORGANISM="Genus nov. species nov., Strain RCC2288" /LENGTH=223 /DNA_ID=CAMNT_0043151307 /DNA_START=47 /DNA_END=718 /DNA_ORIENTATION=-
MTVFETNRVDDNDAAEENANIVEATTGEEGDTPGWVNDSEDEQGEWEDPSKGGILTQVMEACEGGDADALAGLIGNLSVGLDEKGEEGDTALHLACLYGHHACVARLLSEGASPFVQDSDGGTPLHDATAGGYVEIVRALLAAAAALGGAVLERCVNAQDGDGEVPLHCAARGDHVEVVRALLAAGAAADVKSEAGLLPYQFSGEGSEVEALCKPEGTEEPTL